MSDCATATVTLVFEKSSRPRQLHPVASNREPRVARHLAHALPVFALTRARITQIVSLSRVHVQTDEIRSRLWPGWNSSAATQAA